MSLKTSATRYARALLDVAVTQSDPSRVESDLTAMANLVTGNAELHVALTNPRVPEGARTALVRALAERTHIDVLVTRLLVLLAERGRLELFPAIAEAYRERLLAYRKIVRAQVTTPAPLSDERTNALRESLSRVTGREVQLDVAVDPTLIGGVVARIGSTVYDGSVRTQLQKVRRQLLGAGL
jgi:F-type H+-transporting ATPase subunit delta